MLMLPLVTVESAENNHMLPDLPDAATPVPNVTLPVLPDAFEPLLNIIRPEIPDDTSKPRIITAPDDAVPDEATILTAPPVAVPVPL